MNAVSAIIRILGAIANAFNISKKKRYSNDPASAVSNGGRVLDSDKSFADLAAESKRDPVE